MTQYKSCNECGALMSAIYPNMNKLDIVLCEFTGLIANGNYEDRITINCNHCFVKDYGIKHMFSADDVGVGISYGLSNGMFSRKFLVNEKITTRDIMSLAKLRNNTTNKIKLYDSYLKDKSNIVNVFQSAALQDVQKKFESILGSVNNLYTENINDDVIKYYDHDEIKARYKIELDIFDMEIDDIFDDEFLVFNTFVNTRNNKYSKELRNLQIVRDNIDGALEAFPLKVPRKDAINLLIGNNLR